jgi:hypothetical protein
MSDRPYLDSEEIPRLAAAFEACTLPREEWTHRAHLTVALWYLSRLPFEAAEETVRAGIQRYNAACSIVTTETSGYHETLTRFYVLVVGRFVREEPPGGDWAARANALFERYGARDLPLRHYSKARLMSREARLGWIEPDLCPLD